VVQKHNDQISLLTRHLVVKVRQTGGKVMFCECFTFSPSKFKHLEVSNIFLVYLE